MNTYATTETPAQASDRRHGGTLTPTGQCTHTGTYTDKDTTTDTDSDDATTPSATHE